MNQRDRSAAIQSTTCSTRAIRAAIGAAPLVPALRRRLRTIWNRHAPGLCHKAAVFLEQFAEHLPRAPYRGADLLAACAEAEEMHDHVVALEALSQEIRDTLLARRRQGMRMARAVIRCMEVAVADPFLDEMIRARLLISLKHLRREHDRRNHRIAAGVARAWAHLRAAGPAAAPRPAPEIIEAILEP